MSVSAQTRGTPRANVPGLRLLDDIGSFLGLLGAASRAAATYRAYGELSDGELARQGLRRQDLPRLAAREIGLG